jgi:hypothetical protein
MVQEYAKEEAHFGEDMRYSMILGSEKFVDEIRRRFLPEQLDDEITTQKQIAGSLDLDSRLLKAADSLGYNIEQFKKLSRVSGKEKEKRDILIYLLWQTGLIPNKKIADIFRLTPSSVSHSVKAQKIRLQNSPDLKAKFDQLNSLFRV